MGSMNVFAGGAWRKAKGAHVFTGGAWRKAKAVWVFTGGAWRKQSFGGTPFTMGVASNGRGVYGYSTDSRLGLDAGTISPNPVPDLGTITEFYWTNGPEVQGDYDYSLTVAGIPDGTTVTLTVNVGGTEVSGPLTLGYNTAQDPAAEWGGAIAYLAENVTSEISFTANIAR